MTCSIRPITPDDIEACGTIIYKAMNGVASRHGFPLDFKEINEALGFIKMLVHNPLIYGVVAEAEGKVVGSNFLDMRNSIYGFGPTTVDPDVQLKGVGRQLVKAILHHNKDSHSIRLVTESYNMVSACLYTSMGFVTREPALLITGKVSKVENKIEIRLLTINDLDECAKLCQKIYGFERTNELKNVITDFSEFAPLAAIRNGKIVAYASSIAFWPTNHAVAETEEDLCSLLAGAGSLSKHPLAFLLPTRQTKVFRWCVSNGLRAQRPETIMSLGEYHKPQGYYLPSAQF
jgi:predicted N-acetyltransferase YhbS